MQYIISQSFSLSAHFNKVQICIALKPLTFCSTFWVAHFSFRKTSSEECSSDILHSLVYHLKLETSTSIYVLFKVSKEGKKLQWLEEPCYLNFRDHCIHFAFSVLNIFFPYFFFLFIFFTWGLKEGTKWMNIFEVQHLNPNFGENNKNDYLSLHK